MKKILVRILIGASILMVAAVFFFFFFLNSIVKKGVETAGPQVTKVEVRLGGADISPFSGSGTLKDFFLGNPEGFKSASAFKVGMVKVKIDPKSVFSDTIVIEEVVVDGAEITLEAGPGGINLNKIKSNVEAVAASIQGQPGAKDNSATPAAKNEKKFIVKDIVIRNVKLNFGMTLVGAQSLPQLEEIHIRDIGTAGNGVSSAELVKRVINPVFASAIRAGSQALLNVGKGMENLGKDGANTLKDATKGIKGLFK